MKRAIYTLGFSTLVACAGGPSAQHPSATELDSTAQSSSPPSQTEGLNSAAARPDQPSSALIPIESFDAVWGDPNAPVTIVTFNDFQCPFCSRGHHTIVQLMQNHGPSKIRVVFKHNPLAFHEHALPAAILSQAVLSELGPKAFFEFAERIFNDQRSLEPDWLVFQAAEVGLSPIRLSALLDSEVPQEQVEAHQALVKKLGVVGTPAFFINGIRVVGAQPIEEFEARIQSELALAASRDPQGSTSFYAERVRNNYQAPQGSRDRSEESADDTQTWRIPVGKSYTKGPSSALVTLIEFISYKSSLNKRRQIAIREIINQYPDQVRLVIKHSPADSDPEAEAAALLALEALKQKGAQGFWQVHEMLFASPDLSEAQLLKIAKAAQLNQAQVQAALKNKAQLSVVQQDRDLAYEFSGENILFVNGQRFVSSSEAELKRLVEAKLEAANQAINSGVSRASYYATLLESAKGAPPLKVVSIPAPTAANPSRGPLGAPVVVQMFMNLQCPFCLRVRPTLAELEKQYPNQIRFVWRNLPLDMHKAARPAANAAFEVFAQKGQGAFWKYIDQVLDAQGRNNLSEEINGIALGLGLDPARFQQAMAQNTHDAKIQADLDIADAAGIRGTPAFVINGYQVSGAQKLPVFRRVINRALEDRRLGRKPGDADK